MFSVLLKLMLAHFLTDFVLQPNSWIADKNRYKARSSRLYMHVGIYFLLSWAFLKFDLKMLPYIGFMSVFHLLTDLSKLNIEPFTKRKTLLFLTDQALHIASIIAISFLIRPAEFRLWEMDNRLWLLFIALILLTQVTAVVIKVAINKWRIENPSLTDAGKYIGMGERLLIFFFVVTNHWEGVGFLLAAKSIFRFGDLNKNNDLKLTEYVLIGTLLSFGIALLISYGYTVAKAWV